MTVAEDLPGCPATRRCSSVLQNLIGNAIKFRGRRAAARSRIGVGTTATCWEFTVADNGIGIEPEYADRIFVIFQRLHPKDAYPGTGIGLAMCRKIVEYHGGQIWLDTSEPTAGPRSASPCPSRDHDRLTSRSPPDETTDPTAALPA